MTTRDGQESGQHDDGTFAGFCPYDCSRVAHAVCFLDGFYLQIHLRMRALSRVQSLPNPGVRACVMKLTVARKVQRQRIQAVPDLIRMERPFTA